MTEPRIDLLSMTPAELRAHVGDFLRARREPVYRTEQIAGWVYGGEARSLEEMTNLPRELRGALATTFTLAEAEVERVSRSADGTAKHLWRLPDGELIESVLIPAADRLTLCISSQAGCAMGCTFCATGWSGFARQLTAGEIVAQFRASRRWAAAEGYPPISNIVFMGMGEPLANRPAVMPALTILNQGYGVGARRITVSTVGVVPGILELARRPEQFRLAVSLHSPDSELRKELIPLEKRYPLPELVEALKAFDAAGGKRITFEYTMIDGVNDDPALAARLAELASGLQAFVNLIPFNPIPYRDWRPSPGGRIRAFLKVLEDRGVSAAVREPRGRDIDAACGQLRARAVAEKALPVLDHRAEVPVRDERAEVHVLEDQAQVAVPRSGRRSA
ncbi:MAG: 23S rRNA (adenine(2503)-C(2))-methyltransferase RlmN [Gemmatimonadetes bacterium]|nr:23S rRNA (adenine(2503)-C(2))-methyltransferase RlmN [Gemmatimonadota bacterium]